MTTPTQQDQFASVIVDQAIAIAAIPWPCPCEIGPDGRYRLEELIAVGSGSFVYRATDRLLSSQGFDASVAVKIVPRQEGARSEALPARRVKHPNIARVLDRGSLDERHDFTVVEFIGGGTLADVPPKWPPRDAAAFMAQVARGVQAAHSAGVFHLDLKPSNILLTEERMPKVTDFGLARLDHEEEGPSRGTRAFMSPEQARHEPGSLAPPSDIYALGGLLYYLIRGEPPNGADAATIEQRQREGSAPQPLRAGRDLDRICARALAPDPHDRYAAAAQFADDLERWLENKPIDWTQPPPWRRLRLWSRREPASAAGVLVLFVLAIGAFVFWRMDEMRRFQHQLLVLTEAQKEINKTRAYSRAAIAQLYRVYEASDRDQIASSLVWLNLLYEFMIVRDDALVDPQALEEPMMGLIQDLESTGQSETIESLLAHSTLAFWRLRAAEPENALKELDLIEAHWKTIVPQSDTYWARHRAQRAIAEAMIAIRQKNVSPSQVAALQACRKELRAFEPNSRLVSMVEVTLRRAED